MKKNNSRYIAVLLVLILAAVSADAYLRYKKEVNPEYNLLKVQDDPMSLTGFIEVDISTADNAMVLTNKCRSLVMSTNDVQTYSIQQGLDNKIDTRPLTHDIVKGILNNYDIKVLMVKVTELDKGLYRGNLFLKQGNQLLNLETRPSDSIALAVRESAPIYVQKDILDKYGQYSC